MFCRKCGNQFDNSLDFCPNCNEPVPEAARKNRQQTENIVPPAPEAPMPGRKCPNCLFDNKGSSKYCASCGADMDAVSAPSQDDFSGAHMNDYTSPFKGDSVGSSAGDPYAAPDSSFGGASGAPSMEYNADAVTGGAAAATKKKFPVKIAVIAAAALIVIIVLLVFLIGGMTSNEPIPALLNASKNLDEDLLDAKSFHVDLKQDGNKKKVDVQYDIGKKEIYFYYKDDSSEMGGYITEKEGKIAEDNGYNMYTEKLSKKDCATIWSALENDNYENIEALEEIFKKKEIGNAVEAIIKGVNSSDFQNDLTEALEIEYEKGSDGYVYTCEFSGKSLADALEVIVDMVDEYAGEYGNKDFDDILDEIKDDGVDELKGLGKSTLGEAEWVIDDGRFKSIEFEMEEDDGDAMNFTCEFEYGSFSKLESIDITYEEKTTYYDYWDGKVTRKSEYKVEFSEFGEVDVVNDCMSKSIKKELKLDKK